MSKNKVSIIGAGNVGATATYYIAEKVIADLVMVDVAGGMTQAKAVDFLHAGPLRGYDVSISIVGTDDFAQIADSNVVVITAGLPRKLGMDRMDLLKVNAGIVKQAARAIVEHAPNAIVIVVSNPLDIMCHVALRSTGFALRHVVGIRAPDLHAGEIAQERGQAFVVDRDVREQRIERRLVRLRHGAEGIERSQDERLFGVGELDVDHGYGGLATRQGPLDPGVAIDQPARHPVDDHLLHPADLVERSLEGVELALRVGAPVATVRDQVGGRDFAGSDDAVAPGGLRGDRGHATAPRTPAADRRPNQEGVPGRIHWRSALSGTTGAASSIRCTLPGPTTREKHDSEPGELLGHVGRHT